MIKEKTVSSLKKLMIFIGTLGEESTKDQIISIQKRKGKYTIFYWSSSTNIYAP